MAFRILASASRPLRSISTRAAATVFVRSGPTALLSASHRVVPHYFGSSTSNMDSRSFSSSLRARATEDADADYRIFVDRLKNSPQMQKIANSPSAMAALMEMAKILQDAGINMTRKPSMFEMMKLASNTEFRTAANKVVEEFKKAGVELNSESMMQMFGNSSLTGPKK
ncbi:hypothetical protein FRC01_005326 [Tulasnella sp. 417]|nr:hypothetical protein FRC01_005326 [Tulasnella sp. 417]